MSNNCQYCGAERKKAPFNFCNKECQTKFDKIKTKYYNLIKQICALSYPYGGSNEKWEYEYRFHINISTGYCSFEDWNTSGTFKK